MMVGKTDMTMRPADRERRGARARNEEGVSATLVILSFFMLLGVAALAIDGGFLWLSQRGQVADTDSAALSAARLLLDDQCATQTEVDTVAARTVDLNDSRTSLYDRDPLAGGDNVEVRRPSGSTCSDPNVTVVVTTEREAASVFSGALGFGAVDTGVVSYAQVGAATDFSGVLPFALCDKTDHVLEWKAYVNARRAADPNALVDYFAAATAFDAAAVPPVPPHSTASYSGAQTPVHRIPFTKNFVGVDACGVDSPGNWGYVDFDGGSVGSGSCSADALCSWVRNGYEPGVTIGTPGDPLTYDCDGSDTESPTDDCQAGPGFRKDLQDELETYWKCPSGVLTEDCPTLYFVLYDGPGVSDGATPAPGGGATDAYNLSGVIGVVLRDIGPNTPPVTSSTAYMDLEFVDKAYTGPVTSIPSGYTGPLAPVLCGASTFDRCNQ